MPFGPARAAGDPQGFHLIRASELRPFVRWLESASLPVRSYTARVGLPADLLGDPSLLLPAAAYRRFLEHAASGDVGPGLGWSAASATEAVELGAVARARAAGGSAREVITRFCREILWDSTFSDFGLWELPGGAWFWRASPRWPASAEEVTEQYVVAMMLGFVRGLVGSSWRPVRVMLQMEGVDDLGRELLGDPELLLGSPVTAIAIPAADLAQQVEPLRAEAPRLGREPLTDLVSGLRQALMAALPESPGVDWGAAATRTSRRTLQRMLAARGFTWAALLEDARRETAFRHLAQGNLSIREVAERTGYRDPGSFTRAFRRWTGSSPRDFQLAGRGPGER